MNNKNQEMHSEHSHEYHHHHDGCCAPKEPTLRDPLKVGRNDPCLCGSGKKYKKCCANN